MWTPRFAGSDSEPLYRQIIQALADDVASGRLAAGTVLPPHRALAERLGVARATVAQAYTEAAQLGLLRSHVGRGTVVLSPDSGQRPFSTLLEAPTTFNDLSTNWPLSKIDPDPAEALRTLARRPDRMALLRYQPHVGMRRHRRLGVEWARRFGVTASEDQVLVCAGAQHALFAVLAHLLEPKDVLLVEEWSYPGLHGIAETLRIRLVPVPMDAEGLSPHALEAACRRHRAKALYCMPTAHNPLGMVLSSARRQQLAQIARRCNLTLVEDDAHRLLVPDPPPPLYEAASERTFFIASTSKALCAGLRVAFLIAPSAHVAAVARHLWATHWMVSPIGPEIVGIWTEAGTADRTIQLKRREAAVRQRLAAKVFAAHRTLAHPNALHLWLWLPLGWQADELAAQARQQNIAVTPSSAFWMGSKQPRQAIRIALGGVDSRKELKRGLERLAQLIDSG